MTQTEQIRQHLDAGRSITPLDALNLYGCARLAARIHDLKRSGYPVHAESVKRNGKTFFRYSKG